MRCDRRHTEKLASGPSDAPERKINCRSPLSTVEWCASLISIKSPPRRDRLCFWPHEFEVYAMRDGFPHGGAIGFGLAFAIALSLLVFIAWGGHLH
jgi:hypothetical protein